MKKLNLNVILTIVGFVGLLIIAIISIVESETGSVVSLVSAIPSSILYASIFIVGYISNQMNKKRGRYEEEK